MLTPPTGVCRTVNDSPTGPALVDLATTLAVACLTLLSCSASIAKSSKRLRPHWCSSLGQAGFDEHHLPSRQLVAMHDRRTRSAPVPRNHPAGPWAGPVCMLLLPHIAHSASIRPVPACRPANRRHVAVFFGNEYYSSPSRSAWIRHKRSPILPAGPALV